MLRRRQISVGDPHIPHIAQSDTPEYHGPSPGQPSSAAAVTPSFIVSSPTTSGNSPTSHKHPTPFVPQHGRPNHRGGRVAAQIPPPAPQLESNNWPSRFLLSGPFPKPPPADAMGTAHGVVPFGAACTTRRSVNGSAGQAESDTQPCFVPHDGPAPARPSL